NRPRAIAVMERYKLDGLIAFNPINVYYLTNTLTTMTKFRSEFGGFATFARDPAQPSFLVASGGQAWDLVNGDREVPEIIAVTGAANAGAFANATPEQLKTEPKATQRNRTIRSGVALTPREQRWMEMDAKPGAPSPAWGLVRALKESGLAKGRVAVDDMRIKYMLDQIGFDTVTIVPGEQIFKLIRMVKTEPELALMRIAGQNNATAALNAIRTIEKGMTFAEIERRFRVECAALGSEMTSFLSGMSIGLFPDGEAVEGKPFLVDAVSHFKEYHGDFSRTVCVGEPSKEVIARAKANQEGRDAVFAVIKPSLKFSDLTRIGLEAQVKAGMPASIATSSPHTLGLEHGDNPVRIEGLYGPPIDHVLEENMVLTVDFPYLEIGWGAGHNEDLIRITKSGFEPFNRISDPLEIV
ncbi:MAG: aminopeptidase P family protein, partial [Alphaproteobacteria bacterium]|nr:aminopeptidase P family protein [Alphaproteobacteria bacterium]